MAYTRLLTLSRVPLVSRYCNQIRIFAVQQYVRGNGEVYQSMKTVAMATVLHIARRLSFFQA
jgi:hypothetical protein